MFEKVISFFEDEYDKVNEHPANLGETYFEHLRTALSYSFDLLVASIAAFVHAFYPPVHETTASKIIKRLYRSLSDRGAL